MTKSLLIEEFHLGVFVPRDLPEAECNAVRRVLDDKEFQASLRGAVTGVLRDHPALAKVGVRLSR